MQAQRIITPTSGSGRGRNPAFQDPQVKQTLVRLHSEINALKPQGSLLRHDMAQFIAKPVLQYMYQSGNATAQKIFNGNQHSQARRDQQGQIRNGSSFFSWTINAFAGLLSDIVLSDNLQSIIRGDRNIQKAQRALASGGWNTFKRVCAKQIASWYLVNRQRILNNYIAQYGSDPQQLAGRYVNHPGLTRIIQAATTAIDSGDKSVGAMLRRTNSNLGNLVPVPGQGGPVPPPITPGGAAVPMGMPQATTYTTSSSSSSSSSSVPPV